MTARLIFQIGFTKNRKMSQSIKALLNDEEVSWSTDDGKYLTSNKDRVYKNTIWHMADRELAPDDVLKIEVKTYLTGVGKDEERTYTAFYYADEDSPVREHNVKGVGHKGYPLLKGRFQEVAAVYEEDKRLGEIQDFINREF